MEFLDDPTTAALKRVNRHVKAMFDRYLANFVCMQLSIDRYHKRGKYILIIKEEDALAGASLRIISCRPQSMQMVQTVLRLRPDIKTLIVDQWLEAQVATQLFAQDLQGCIKRLIFQKFVWYEERA